ncbi:hypothetical protein [Ectopseudomonas khazarica]|uniref:hypothetical protein n=1 Tax=Ectopseudomonas khazarica TaxID=2502979 RepID=UPI0037C9BE4F
MPTATFKEIKDFLEKKGIGTDKRFVVSTGKSALILFSLVTAHYAGFLVRLPFEMLSIVAIDLLPLFVSLLVLYFSLCYTIAKVFSFTVQQFYSSFLILVVASVFRVGAWFGRLPKQGAKMYREVRVVEKIIYIFFLIMIFLFTFDFAYLNLSFEALKGWVGICAVISVVALLLKTDVLSRGAGQVKRRLFDKRRVRYRRKVLEAALYIVAGSMLAFSFYSGYWRYDKLIGEEPLKIESDRYSGVVNVLIGSGSYFYGIERCSAGGNYIYVSNEFVVRLGLGDGSGGKKEIIECEEGYIPVAQNGVPEKS